MNNVDVDDVSCDEDEYGNLLPRMFMQGSIADCNSLIYFACGEPEDVEKSYWW